jgi:hypothetical protein
MDALVMAGLDPANQTPNSGVWMAGSTPGMTARVRNDHRNSGTGDRRPKPREVAL